jgi:hypothetical protein
MRLAARAKTPPTAPHAAAITNAAATSNAGGGRTAGCSYVDERYITTTPKRPLVKMATKVTAAPYRNDDVAFCHPAQDPKIAATNSVMAKPTVAETRGSKVAKPPPANSAVATIVNMCLVRSYDVEILRGAFPSVVFPISATWKLWLASCTADDSCNECVAVRPCRIIGWQGLALTLKTAQQSILEIAILRTVLLRTPISIAIAFWLVWLLHRLAIRKAWLWAINLKAHVNIFQDTPRQDSNVSHLSA